MLYLPILCYTHIIAVATCNRVNLMSNRIKSRVFYLKMPCVGGCL
jgi:hypothetical protein